MKTPKIYSNFRLREIVEEFIYSERDRAVLIEKYCNRKTISQMAELFQLSETSIKNIIYRNSFLIFDIMEKEKPKDV